jgi:hypothetical protein
MPTPHSRHIRDPGGEHEADKPDEQHRRELTAFLATLNHEQRRLFAAVESKRIGRGGVRKVAELTGLCLQTIARGRRQLTELVQGTFRKKERKPIPGRPRTEEKYPAVAAALEELLTDEVAGSPEGEQKWVRSSVRKLAKRLKERGFCVGPKAVWGMLKRMRFSLKTAIRRRRGVTRDPARRDEQFRHIASQRKRFMRAGKPVISVDTKKKELVGIFRNPGRSWCRQAAEVDEHDFPSQAEGIATPFGVYDVAKNRGFELPRLVINEAYAQIDNDQADGPGNVDFLVKFWVELHNPLLPDSNRKDPLNAANAAYNGAARLTLPPALVDPNNPYPPYRVVIAQGPQAAWAAGSKLSDPGNTRGDVPAANIKAVVQNWAPAAATATVDTTVVLAANGAYSGPNNSNQGFFVTGPNEPFPLAAGAAVPANYPNPTLKLQYTAGAGGQVMEPVTGGAFTNGMTYQWVVATNGAVPAPFYHSIVLQRLACPYLPFNNTPSVNGQPNPLYNPYITVDYLDSIPTYDGRTMVAGAANPAVVADYTQRYAWGRKQPYAAFSDITYTPPAAAGPGTYTPVTTDSQVLPQNPDSMNTPPTSTPYAGEPRHTFFQANGVTSTPPPNPDPYGPNETLTVPFDWLTHIDRQLVNPAELLTISACRPSQLTQLFMYTTGGATPTTQAFAHLAPWRDQTSRLYRFLEFVKTDSRTPNIEAGGRLPGKINLNTIWDPEILDALCDPQPASYFPASVTTAQLFQKVIKSRSPDLVTGNALVTGTNDRPFLALSAGVIPPGDPQWPSANGGINDTILRTDPDDPTNTKPLFGVSSATQRNPYLQNELVQKVFNNVTTRSNVYAVWVTVGFFEVTDASARPVKLGAEIGKAENRNVRHRLFAILDRSNVAVPSQLTMVAQGVTGNPAAPQPMQVGAVSGTLTAPPPVGVTLNWSFQPGTQVTVNAGNFNEETVTITAAAAGTITAVFTKDHQQGETLTVPGTPGSVPNTVLGNPGPQQRYDPRANSAVVLHFNIIE